MHAETCLEAIRGIINARVDHLAVVAANLGPNDVVTLQNKRTSLGKGHQFT